MSQHEIPVPGRVRLLNHWLRLSSAEGESAENSPIEIQTNLAATVIVLRPRKTRPQDWPTRIVSTNEYF
jgi:hypothetical protein